VRSETGKRRRPSRFGWAVHFGLLKAESPP
jgi:hypothetical protein